jgi:hypothetical protein
MTSLIRTDEQIAQVAAALGAGFHADVTRGATRRPDLAWAIEPAHWFSTLARYRRHATPAPAEPTLAELAANFTSAVARWIGAGAPVVAEATYHARAAACAACSLWDASARAGLGKCQAPGCGCTKLKRWLATERCPLGKWPELVTPPRP